LARAWLSSQLDFKTWREETGLGKDYLPDEYQYPMDENAGGGDTFEQEANRSGTRSKLEEMAGKDLDPDHDPALSRFYLRDPMKVRVVLRWFSQCFKGLSRVSEGLLIVF